MVPRHLNDPLTIMANRVHSASHSSMLQGHYSNNHLGNERTVTDNPGVLRYLCEVRTTARLSRMTLMMEFHRKRLERGSMPVVGSS